MANEASIRTRTHHPVNFTNTTDANGIEKGAFLVLGDARKVSGAADDSTGLACAGICAREKIASDGRTEVATFTRGRFDVVASGAIHLGGEIQLADSNKVMLASAVASGAQIIGTALETAADEETFQMELKL